MADDLLVALDIGGTKLAVGVAPRPEFARTGRPEAIAKMPVPEPKTPDDVIPHLLRSVRHMAMGRPIAGVGISIGGPLDHEQGVVINFPHLPGWKNIPLRAVIERELGVPAALDNDANLGALAEYRWGGGQGCDPFVYLTISTGIGGGVIVGGKLIHGVASGGGEVGHITVQTGGPLCPCGNRGCLERMASGTNIALRGRALAAEDPVAGRHLLSLADGRPERITSETVLQGYRSGDPLSRRVWEEAAEYLAIGLGSIIHVLAPQRIVLGGGVAQAGEDLLGPVRRRLRDHVFYIPPDRIDLVAASLGHDSALIGAMIAAADLAEA